MRDRLAPWLAPAVGAVLGLVRMTSFDLPLMIASGDRLLATGEVPRTNVFHWPDPTFPWLDDKWGFGLLCAAVHRAAGPAGLTLLNAVLGAVAGALLFLLARRRNLPWVAAGLAVAGVTMLSYRSMLRAEWISFLGVAWTLLHVDGVVAGSRKHTALLVAAVPVWAACHVYWILAPVLVAAAAVRRLSWRAGAAAVAVFAAGAASPYGLENLVHPFRIAAGAGSLEGAITELRLPFTAPVTFFHALAALLAVLTALWAVPRALRRGHGPDDLLALLLLGLAFRYDRNLAFAGISFVLAAPRAPEGRVERVAGWLGWTAAPAVAGLLAGIGWLAPERRPGLGWDERAFPLRLASSLPPETARHRYVNDFSLGSFLDWARRSSFIDGNTHGYPAAHFDTYRRALEGSLVVGEIDRRFPNDGWLLRTSAPHTRVLVVGLLLEGDYAPTDWDDVATLFRPVPDVERADELWRRWLAETYLPVARAWFPTAEDLFAGGRAAPADDDVAGWRALVVASPWERTFLEGLRRACDRRRDDVQAARVWRLARRIP